MCSISTVDPKLFLPQAHLPSPLFSNRELGQSKMTSCGGAEELIVSQEAGPAALGNKYGGLAPKKKPLISKDNGRAFFDSADWALGKQGGEGGQKSRDVVETLRPKLQRTPHQQLPPRRPSCTSGRETMVE